MLLVTQHPVLFSEFGFGQESSLHDLRQKLQTESNCSCSIEDTNFTEYFAFLYPRKVAIEFLKSSIAAKYIIERMTLEVFSCGFGLISVHQRLPSDVIDRDSLIDYIDEELRPHLTNFLAQEQLFQTLTEYFSVNFGSPGKKTEGLLYAYSQIIFCENDSEWLEMQSLVNSEEYEGAELGKLKMDASFTCFRLTQHEKLRVYAEMIGSVIITTAILYELQRLAITISRQITAEPDAISRTSSLGDYINMVNLCQQFQTELVQDDFLATADEEQVARNLATTWHLFELGSKTGSVLKSLAQRIDSLEVKQTFKNQNRSNLIFLGFTLISILSVTGDVLILYDISNEIMPKIRLLTVGSIFGLCLVVSLVILRKK